MHRLHWQITTKALSRAAVRAMLALKTAAAAKLALAPVKVARARAALVAKVAVRKGAAVKKAAAPVKKAPAKVAAVKAVKKVVVGMAAKSLLKP